MFGDHLTKHELANFFWAKVSALLLQTSTQPLQSAEVFELAEILLENHADDLALSLHDLVQYFGEWSMLLAKHQHEEFVGQDNVDPIVRGLSSILRLCTLALPLSETEPSSRELVQQVWNKFLFPRKSIAFTEQPMTVQALPVLESTTRQSMLKLIMTLINGSNRLMEDFLHLAAKPRLDERFRRGWSIDRSTILRAPSGFVGMKNLGNTCYMNSLLTQLFMNPGFRAFLLRCRTSTSASTARLLFETQNLFAHMQNSYAKAADASEFTCNIKTLTEDPIDVREQMDVDEFMNTLFMRWEEQMLSNESKEEFRSFYSGKTIQQIKSKECDHVSERDDTCLAIQCDVQGKATLEESLQAYIEGDVMQGGEYQKPIICQKTNHRQTINTNASRAASSLTLSNGT
jgi:ubiquitin carboxyl-terminal hydrolase 34